MVTINLLGKDIELYYNTKAMMDISKRCGSLDNLFEWLNISNYNDNNENNFNRSELISKYAGLLCDLANGGVYKHNCEIEFGLKDGEKQKFYTDDVFLCLISPNQILRYQEAFFRALNEGSEVSIPESMQSEEPDPDLAEVESEKNL